MPIVILEKLVMNMMISWRSKAQFAKNAIPGKDNFGMDENEPVGVHASKGHVSPNIAIVDYVCGSVEGNENHEHCIGYASVECIKKAGIGKSVVRLVGCLVEFGTNTVLEPVHYILQSVLCDKTCKYS